MTPTKAGICGFPAVGQLAATVSVRFLRALHPDFLILFYPVIPFRENSGIITAGTKGALPEENVNPRRSEDFYFPEKQVPGDTSSVFIIQCEETGGFFTR